MKSKANATGPTFERGDQVRLAVSIKDPDGNPVPSGCPGAVDEPWPLFDRRKGAPSSWRYLVTFNLAGRVIPSCWVDEEKLEPFLLGW